MIVNTPEESPAEFGTYLRELRTAKFEKDPSFSLRGFARMAGVSIAYLSTLETNKGQPPHPRHLRIMATLLDTDYEELLARSGRVTDELSEIMATSPGARALVRACGSLSEESIGALLEAAHVVSERPESASWYATLTRGIKEGKAGKRQIRI